MHAKRWAALAALASWALVSSPVANAAPPDAHPTGPSLRQPVATRLGAGPIASDGARRFIPPPRAAVPPPPPPPPPFVCPVQGPMAFVDSYGAPRRGHRHEGVDMMAAQGTPVVAPVSGTVVQRGSAAGGLAFHLTGDDGTFYYGAHLSTYAASGWVPQGTVVGFVGDTGNARGAPHLHFEIHPGGEQQPAINPYPTVAAYCAAPAA